MLGRAAERRAPGRAPEVRCAGDRDAQTAALVLAVAGRIDEMTGG